MCVELGRALITSLSGYKLRELVLTELTSIRVYFAAMALPNQQKQSFGGEILKHQHRVEWDVWQFFKQIKDGQVGLRRVDLIETPT